MNAPVVQTPAGAKPELVLSQEQIRAIASWILVRRKVRKELALQAEQAKAEENKS